MAKFRFTDTELRDLEAEPSRPVIHYDEPAPTGKGDFVRGFAIQITPAGRKTFLLVYVAKLSGRERRMVIGEYGAAPRLSLSAARQRAATLRVQVDAGRDPWLEAKETRAAAEAAEVKGKATLAGLLAAYVAHLKAAGKPSAQEVADSVERNLALPYPKIAALVAEKVTVEDLMPVLRRLTKAEKWRAAEKLISYLRSAYNSAVAATTDAGAHAFDGFDLRSNPLLALKVKRPAEGAERALEPAQDRDALSEAELREYWNAIKKLDSPHGALLRFHLLTGGQRMEQLSRLTVRDVDLEAGTFTLYDTKGRRPKPRKHLVPLLPEAIDAIRGMRSDEPRGEWMFTVSHGSKAAVPHTLASEMRAISDVLREKGKVSMTITPGTIRRTIETLLAAAKVSKEVRAHLQSHGLGGVQDRHYDRHDYLDEKREALEVLRALLEKSTKHAGTLVPIRANR